MHSGSISFGEIRLGGRFGGVVAALAVLAFVLWVAAYVTGLFPWTGREGGTLKSIGAGKITVIGNQNRTNSIGFKTFYYWEGQEAVLHHETDIREGGLRIYLAEGGGLRSPVIDTVTVNESGEGEIVYKVPKSGFYRWSINPTVTHGGKGYDLTYKAIWGARLAD
jgi:hypothetical protein